MLCFLEKSGGVEVWFNTAALEAVVNMSVLAPCETQGEVTNWLVMFLRTVLENINLAGSFRAQRSTFTPFIPFWRADGPATVSPSAHYLLS
jgi:hypothetical protein